MKKIEVVEMPESLSASEATENIYHVQNRQWRKWNKQARFIFNHVYNQMGDQTCISHPLMPKMRDELWTTIRWNSAWLAADAAWTSINNK